MDTPSDYEDSFPPTEPSTPNGDSITSVLKRVEEDQKLGDLERLEMLTTENLSLQRQIIRYQKTWCALLDLAQKALEAHQRLTSMLEQGSREEIAVERDWLAFWGIQDGEERPGIGWI